MDVILIIVLTLLNGVFAMSEMAISASRRTRLIAMSESGDLGATKAIELMDSPTQFLSTVQIGITSIGMLNGIVGEAAFSDNLAQWLGTLGVTTKAANFSATAIVVVLITFTTIIFGELVPKRIGQMFPEIVAKWISRPMALLAIVAKPFVRLLSGSTSKILKLLRVDVNAARDVTEDEIQASLKEGVDAGVIDANEHQMVRNLFHLDDRDLSSLMVPRVDVEWLDGTLTIDEAIAVLSRPSHGVARIEFIGWYPVCQGGLDNVLGVVSLRQLLQVSDRSQQVGDIALAAIFAPETISGLELVSKFRDRDVDMIFVVDEYGVVQGTVNARDFLDAITGALTSLDGAPSVQASNMKASWTIDGGMPINDLKALLKLAELTDERLGRYSTVAGLVGALAGRIPVLGEQVQVGDWALVVTETSGRRVRKVLAKLS